MATVHLSAMEPIGVSKTAKQSWSDTYITMRFRPNRKANYGPTFISSYAIECDIEHQNWSINNYNELLFDEEKLKAENSRQIWKDLEITFTAENIPESILYCQRKIDRFLEIKDSLAKEQYVIEEMRDKGVPNIYTSAEYLDRQEVENMVRFWLTAQGHKFGKLKWKRQSFIVIPS